MPHTPLLGELRTLAHAARLAAERNVEVERVLDGVAPAYSRRHFMRQLGIAATAAAGSPLLRAGPRPHPQARVAVVGAGLAGLTCAYRLKQAGIDATIYEANSRVGGRCWTRRGDFAEGQIAEHGGELIDQSHTHIRQLAQELRLPLDNVLAAEPSGTEAFFHFDGAAYPYVQATADLKGIWQKLHRDLSEASYPTLYNQSTPRGRQLDQMSIIDWIEETVPGGRRSRLGQLLDVAYNIEYGAECEAQSALNLLYLLGYNSPGQFSLFGASNEKYHVRGGNDRIVSTLAYVLGSQIAPNTRLVALRRTAAGAYVLTLGSGGRLFESTVDQVVLALPFSILRSDVDLGGAGFSDLKRVAIRELAMGSNSKLNVQFTGRDWVRLGNNGDTFSDTGYQATWEVTRAQPGAAGILVAYSGGTHADSFGRGTLTTQTANFLSQLEPVLPGVPSTFNGRATLDYWRGNPFTRGSYAYWQRGQYTRFAGIEGAREGNAHFCGEHTSIDAQGYLNGAVETGERVAAEITADVAK